MANIEIHLPEEIKDYAPDLHFFFSTMVRKLHTNRHKGTNHKDTPDVMVAEGLREIEEVWRAMSKEGQFETAVECVDVSNFMFLAARACWNMTRQQFEDLRNGGVNNGQ